MPWELHLEGSRSLKDKRHVLKSLKDRLHNRFNVSAAETAHHDLWQRAELTVCVVSNERGHAESVLREADRPVAGAAGARLADTSTRHLWGDAAPRRPPPPTPRARRRGDPAPWRGISRRPR